MTRQPARGEALHGRVADAAGGAGEDQRLALGVGRGGHAAGAVTYRPRGRVGRSLAWHVPRPETGRGVRRRCVRCCPSMGRVAGRGAGPRRVDCRPSGRTLAGRRGTLSGRAAGSCRVCCCPAGRAEGARCACRWPCAVSRVSGPRSRAVPSPRRATAPRRCGRTAGGTSPWRRAAPPHARPSADYPEMRAPSRRNRPVRRR